MQFQIIIYLMTPIILVFLLQVSVLVICLAYRNDSNNTTTPQFNKMIAWIKSMLCQIQKSKIESPRGYSKNEDYFNKNDRILILDEEKTKILTSHSQNVKSNRPDLSEDILKVFEQLVSKSLLPCKSSFEKLKRTPSRSRAKPRCKRPHPPAPSLLTPQSRIEYRLLLIDLSIYSKRGVRPMCRIAESSQDDS